MHKPRGTKPSTRNILRVLRHDATAEDFAIGQDWYARAWELACDLDSANPYRAAGVIAAMSPLQSWGVNAKCARDIYAGKPWGLSANVAKAQLILAGNEPLDVLKGAKVRSFYANIVGMRGSIVTVDRHAVDAAYRRVMTNEERQRAVQGKKYTHIVDMYTRATDIFNRENCTNYSPADIQAIAWVAWRRTYATKSHSAVA